MNNVWQRLRQLSRWDQLLLGLFLIAAFGFIFRGLKSNTITVMKLRSSTNSARLYELNNNLSAPSAVSGVEPGGSGGKLANLIISYDKLANTFNEASLDGAPALAGILVNKSAEQYKSFSSSNSLLISEVRSELSAFGQHLRASEKFIEYPPATFLPHDRSGEFNAQVTNTRVGLETVVKDLQALKTPLGDQLSANVSSLLAEPLKRLEQGDTKQWQQAVRSSQNFVLEKLSAEQARIRASRSQQLRAAAAAWSTINYQ